MTSDSEFVRKEPCPACGSRDNLARYSDGHAHCFGCGHYERGGGNTPEPTERKMAKDLIDTTGFTFGPLTKRGINEATCRKWGYQIGTWNGKPVQVADYGSPAAAQKVRFANKDFMTRGEFKSAGLYGQWLWRDGGQMVVVTEGEIDALTVSQLQDNRWPVVSVPNGSDGAAKAIAKSLDWLLKFATIVLMFDNDDTHFKKDGTVYYPGQDAAKESAALFPPGRCKIAKLPLKDANDMLVAGRGKEVIDAIWGAKEFRPDGIVTGKDIREKVLQPTVRGLPWFLKKLDDVTYGRRFGELYALGAGTGIGKTDLITQQVRMDVCELGQAVGLFFYEQQPQETGKRVAGKLAGKLFHIPDDGWTVEELTEAWDKVEALPIYFHDHFGSAKWSECETHIRYLNKAHAVRIFYIDNLTALVDGDDLPEREALEKITAGMGGLVKELDIIIMFISHLTTPDGTPHEEGGRVMIRHFKGSRNIGFWSHFMFGLERDQQSDDEKARTTTTLRVLKDRYTGRATGEVVYLGYDRVTGLLFEHEGNPLDEPAEDIGASGAGDDF